VFIQVNVVGFVIQKESTAESSFQSHKVRKTLLSAELIPHLKEFYLV
jgi:hypothetical protein